MDDQTLHTLKHQFQLSLESESFHLPTALDRFDQLATYCIDQEISLDSQFFTVSSYSMSFISLVITLTDKNLHVRNQCLSIPDCHALLLAMLERGASTQVPDPTNGWKPLHDASRIGEVSLIQLLLDHGADVNARTHVDSQPLSLATEYRHYSVAELLIQRGAHVNGLGAHQSSTSTPLHLAIGNVDLDMVRLLLAHGSDLAMKDPSGRSPLFLAVHRQNLPIARLLVEAGARLHSYNNRGVSVLEYAKHNHPDSKLTSYLKDALYTQTESQILKQITETAMHSSSTSQSLDAVRELGADQESTALQQGSTVCSSSTLKPLRRL